MSPAGRDHSGKSGCYGVAGRRASSVADSVAALVEGFEPGTVGARDALDLVEVFSRIEHVAAAGLLLAARRVAQTDLWKKKGHRSAAHWLSHVTGVSVAEAVGLLDTAEVVETAPDTREALKEGKVSPRQAKAIGRAENADPDAGRRLLGQVERRSTRETESDANRIVAAASGESPEDKAERHRRSRRFRHGFTDDGMGWASWLFPAAEHTRAVALIEGEQAKVFAQKRAAGEREPTEAYAADALCRVLERAAVRTESAGMAGNGRARAARTDTAGGGGPGQGSGTAGGSGSRAGVGASPDSDSDGDGDGVSVVEDWSFSKVIVKVDLTALDRGHTVAGEVCEVAGQGPVPVADVWRMIDGDAFVAAVAARGSEIAKVVHLGRRPTALQRTALEWQSSGVCQIGGCTSTARLENDHVAEWAATERTELGQLARVCGHHHDLKTHHGYRFGPLRRDGTRQLVPPDSTDPPGHDPPGDDWLCADQAGAGPPGDGPPDLGLVEGHADPDDPPGEHTDGEPHQGDLFDTG